jgi:uncharacterized damage-inducible protein DinB
MTEPRKYLIGELTRAHSGEPWHGPSRATVLEGITAAQAAWRPRPDAHCIWELALHMTSWTREVMQRAKGRVPGEPDDGDWPPMPEPTSRAWDEAKRGLVAAHRELLETIDALPDARLEERVGTGSDPQGRGITCRAMLYSLAQHDIYHTGQVAMLKRLASGA